MFCSVPAPDILPNRQKERILVMSKNLSCFCLILPLTVFLVTFAPSRAVGADEGKSEVSDESSSDSGKDEKAKSGKATDLVEKLRALRRQQPTGETLEEKKADYIKTRREAVAIADDLYARATEGESPEYRLAVIALQAKFEMLWQLYQLQDEDFSTDQFLKLAADAEQIYQESKKDPQGGLQVGMMAMQVALQTLSIAQQLEQEDAPSKLASLVTQISEDSRPEIAAIGKQLQLQLKFQLSPDMDAAAIDTLASELEVEFSDREVTESEASIIRNLVSGDEMLGQQQTAIRLYSFFAKKFSESKQEQIQHMAKLWGLAGHTIDLEGTFLDGSELDWASYRGKVVLIDFWASWCVPCREEFPNVLANYEKYHDRGFDVIGINLDDTRKAATSFLDKEKLPWKTLFNDKDGERGFENPLANRYGISGIPTVILVDRKGKVISLQARGEILGKLLAEQFDGIEDSTGGES